MVPRSLAYYSILIVLINTPTLIYSSTISDKQYDVRTRILRVPERLEDIPDYREISEPCRSQLPTLNGSTNKPGTMEMLLAWGRVAEENDNLHWEGSFRECMEIGKLSSDGYNFTGKYCQIQVSPSSEDYEKFGIPKNLINSSLNVGVCVPSTCRDEDLKRFFFSDDLTSSVMFDPNTCQTEISYFDSLTFLSLILSLCLISLILIILLSTWIDWNSPSKQADKPNILWRALLAFSIIRNGQEILSLEHSPGSIPELHGLRVFSMLWIVLLHSYILPIFFLHLRPENYSHFLNDVIDTDQVSWYSMIVTSTFSVDTFFFLSGLLGCYSFIRNMEKTGGTFNPIKSIVNRYARITPVLMFLICAMIFDLTTILIRESSGQIFTQFRNCRKQWWTMLTYVNNYDVTKNYHNVPLQDMCLAHTWSLDCDMQFFILGTLLLYPLLYKFKMLGVAMTSLSLIISIAVTVAISYILDFPTSFISVILNRNLWKTYSWNFYTPAQTRLPPYIVGTLMGYWIARHCKIRRKNSKSFLVTGWLISSTLAFICHIGCSNIIGPQFSPFGRALFNGLNRCLWSLSLCWITYVCRTGQGGIVNTVLSCRFLIPLSRLSFCVYLIHPIVIILLPFVKYIFGYGMKTTYSLLQLAFHYFFTIIVSTVLAFAASTAIELPFIKLNSIFWNEVPIFVRAALNEWKRME